MESISKRLSEVLAKHKEGIYKSFKPNREDFSYAFVFSDWKQAKAFEDDVDDLNSDYFSIMRNNVYTKIDFEKEPTPSENYQELVNLRRLLMENLSHEDIDKGKTKLPMWQITGEETAKTLGFLVKNAHIRADIPYPKQDIFDNLFLNVKGRYPDEDEDGYSPHRCAATRFYCLRMTFKSPEIGLSFPSHIELKEVGKNSIRISNNEYGWELLEKGFGLGKNHDIEEIDSWIPEQYKKAFQEGLTIGG